MLTPPPGLKVLVATKPIDFRKGADGLAALAQEVLKQNPLSGTGGRKPATSGQSPAMTGRGRAQSRQALPTLTRRAAARCMR